MDKHRGELLKSKIDELGIPLSEVAKRAKVSRKTIYNWFDRDDLPLEYMIRVGQILNYDFRQDMPEFKPAEVNEPSTLYGINWKDKYYSLLVENHEITQKYLNLLDKKLQDYALSLV